MKLNTISIIYTAQTCCYTSGTSDHHKTIQYVDNPLNEARLFKVNVSIFINLNPLEIINTLLLK